MPSLPSPLPISVLRSTTTSSTLRQSAPRILARYLSPRTLSTSLPSSTLPHQLPLRSNGAARRAFSTTPAVTMPKYTGSCYCREIKYEIELDSPDQARMSICHCKNCKKFTGGEHGITAKLPRSAFTYIPSSPPSLKKHVADNGSGTLLTREFCGTCGGPIMEYGANAGDNTYVFYGSLDKPRELPPKGEFYCKNRDPWMPEVPGIFHKQEIKE